MAENQEGAGLDYLEPVDYDTIEFGDIYDELSLWSAPFALAMLDRVPMRPGMTVVDIGAGTGLLSIELAERCGPGTSVVTVDPWAGAMTRLRKKLKVRGIRTVRLLEDDAVNLDLPDDSVDLVVSNLGINNFENRGAVLAVVRRILKRDAPLLLTTNLTGHMQEFYDIYRETLHELGLGDREEALDAHIDHRGTVESVSEELRRAGFQQIEVKTDSFCMRFATGSALLRHYIIRAGFMATWKEILPADQLERGFTRLERNLNVLANTKGELALSIPLAVFEAT